MHTVLLWALWVVPYQGATTIPAYFETNTECMRVAAIISKSKVQSYTNVLCVQASYIIVDGAPNALLKSK